MVTTVTVLALGAALAACGDNGRAAPSGSTTASATTPAGTAPSGGSTVSPRSTSPRPTPGTSALTTPSTPAGRTELSDLRIGRNEGHDRVVLQFTGPAPGYTVEAAQGPIADCASGAIVAGAGGYLVIRIDGVQLFGENGETVYTGSKKVTGSGPFVGDATIFCAFEGQLQVAVRLLDGAQRHVNSTLRDPGRIVLDVWKDEGP
ncbi:hypothetical protein AXK61_13370 [Tsukamurella pseudospumae]|uniref:AMIN-like domain-containing protein n=1 Tax=Tsukamurella pseudospumae TaxID=239498 RepID=A0A137ZS17_9ACTN|nr:hypothetical protein AXK61_13370 [Tsukamurella pseudospumae]